MELVTEPDTYAPGTDDTGNYIDQIPVFIHGGIRCPCGSRKNQVYESRSVFTQHIKCIAHQKWLTNLNQNKSNYYIENRELTHTIQQQRMIIAKLEKDLQHKHMTIDFLTQQLTYKPTIVNHLLDFD